jgi:hypothetical protein
MRHHDDLVEWCLQDVALVLVADVVCADEMLVVGRDVAVIDGYLQSKVARTNSVNVLLRGVPFREVCCVLRIPRTLYPGGTYRFQSRTLVHFW